MVPVPHKDGDLVVALYNVLHRTLTATQTTHEEDTYLCHTSRVWTHSVLQPMTATHSCYFYQVLFIVYLTKVVVSRSGLILAPSASKHRARVVMHMQCN